jgi:hypothetical protein
LRRFKIRLQCTNRRATKLYNLLKVENDPSLKEIDLCDTKLTFFRAFKIFDFEWNINLFISGYYLLLYIFFWLCSPARALASSGSAAQRGLWPPVALQLSAGYGLMWLCSPARAMASCGTAAQRGLWPPLLMLVLDR